MANLPAKREKLAEMRDGILTWCDKLPGVLPANVTKERIADVAILVAHDEPLITQCSKGSIIKSVLGAARYSLEIGGHLGQAYLVPFRDNKTGIRHAQLIIGYLGLVDLCYRNDKVALIEPGLVYEGDEFDYRKGTEKYLRHNCREITQDEAKITHAYSIITLTSGEKLFEVMERAKIEKVRARSKAKDDGPWVTDWGAMALKTVFKRNSKWAPKTRDFAQALQFDSKAESADTGFVKDVDIEIVHPEDDSEPPPEKTRTERMAEEVGNDIPPIDMAAIELVAKIKSEFAARKISEELFCKWVRDCGLDDNKDLQIQAVEKLRKLLDKCLAFR